MEYSNGFGPVTQRFDAPGVRSRPHVVAFNGHTNLSKDEIARAVMAGESAWLESVAGVFNAAVVDGNSLRVFVHSFGLHPVFVVRSPTDRVVTLGGIDEYWELVAKVARDTAPDVAIEQLVSTIVWGLKGSWVKGVERLAPGSIYAYTLDDNGSIEERREPLGSTGFTEEIRDSHEALAEIDAAFEDTMAYLRHLVDGSRLLVSVSGGLDSRYALAASQDIQRVCFQLSVRSRLLEPTDTTVARKLSRRAGCGDLNVVSPLSDSMAWKAAIDVDRNPIGNGDLLKATSLEVVGGTARDVLLTGGHGSAVGSRVFSKNLLDRVDQGDLDSILEAYAHPSFRGGGARASSFIRPERLDAAWRYARERLEDLLERSDHDHWAALRQFQYLRHASIGAYETLHRQVFALSVYEPFLYKRFNRFSRDLLLDRYAAREYLAVRHDDLVRGLPLQNLEKLRPGSVEGTLQQAYRKVVNRLSGSSIDYKAWARAVGWTSYALETLEQSRSAVEDLFDLNPTIESLKSGTASRSQPVEDLVKATLVVKRIREA